jgi:ABC-type multidrug transport system ATPase subunit
MNCLAWNDLSFTVGKGASQRKLVDGEPLRPPRSNQRLMYVQGLSGSLSGGSLLAILGPSGAGKSTALDLLSRRKVASSGVVSSSAAIRDAV